MRNSNAIGPRPGLTTGCELLRQATHDLRRLRVTRGRSRRTARQIRRASAMLALALALLGAPGTPPAAAADPDFCFQNFVNAFGLNDVGDDSAPVFGDIDGDGDFDALVGEGLGGVQFFENTGTSTAPAFAAPIQNPFGLTTIGFRSKPELADIDTDGDLDVLIGNLNSDSIFFRNTGTAMAPAFAAPSTNPFGLTTLPMPSYGSSPDLVDIDGDGDLDALIASGVGDTFFFRNTGSATSPAFDTAQMNPFGLFDADGNSAAYADIDGDGDFDALMGETAGNLMFFRNTGTATAAAFAAPVVNPFGLGFIDYSSSPTFNDIDGDGDLDILLGTQSGVLFFLQNTGTAASPAFALPSTNAFGLVDVGSNSAPALADIDADGDVDALIGEGDGNAIFFRNTGTTTAPAFAAPSTNPFGLMDVGLNSAPALADIDGDGDLDALIGERNGNTIFFLNQGTPATPSFIPFVITNPFGLADVGDFSSPTFADIDGDGDLDALLGEYDSFLIFFDNTGTALSPAFGSPATQPFGLSGFRLNTNPVLADVDGDGDLDALIGQMGGKMVFFRNTGTAMTPAFVGFTIAPFGLSGVDSDSSPDLADLDGDGDLDALVGELEGNTIFFENGWCLPPGPTLTPTATASPSPTPTPTTGPPAACPSTPWGGCSTSTKGQLQLRDESDDSKDKLKWKFSGGPALLSSDFGEPRTTASYALCIYDDGVLKMEAFVGPSGTLWKAAGSKGFLFKDPAGSNDGLTTVKLLGGDAGKSALQAKGRGANLPMPSPVSGTQFFDSVTGVTVQLHQNSGDCYETAFTPAQVIKNDGAQFKAKK